MYSTADDSMVNQTLFAQGIAGDRNLKSGLMVADAVNPLYGSYALGIGPNSFLFALWLPWY